MGDSFARSDALEQIEFGLSGLSVSVDVLEDESTNFLPTESVADVKLGDHNHEPN